MRRIAYALPLLVLISACSSKPTPAPQPAQKPKTPTLITPSAHPAFGSVQPITPLRGDYANNANANRFIDMMVSKYGFNRQSLHDLFAQTQELDWVIRLMDRQAPTYTPPSGPNGAWLRYRKKFITPDNVQKGVLFWDQYEADLQRASRTYGVPPEIIVGIIGVETRWGRVMGKTRIIDALATLSFSYPRRAEFFSGELEQFLLQARKEGVDPLSLRGSYAGAMGYGQFMPSSFTKYAVDFDGDGHRDLWNPRDAIGSVANYFKQHGWVTGDAVAIPATGQARSLEDGFKTQYPVSVLANAGLRPQGSLGNHQTASLLRLDMGNTYQYWYGLPNFYVITRYNHSTHYAMAVWELGKAVDRQRHGYR
ncbi:lytic murein transglycosylase B [Pseudomonas nicosulfuronedens]|uniref:Lytic murein transglycosylase B n=1 Tax=Pseudomonas nicosulfuronedens TaxID=2571105 RepID=A0A5R9R8J8_9PSED|nr:lytic murein transglycosylase B [Pseudomonas nicosulfuronedens]MDH1007709.1 lytic murein transglycosylase B [Pseudomonas nicosulfuronedens]MDH1977754.1 lytic murein transglycosylase B [Pseudomonas nicosulfuronedens]MDH2025647.1 lytic murein transglycosylase B [Pseudomonas nicosulfuronedens]TLX79184.1 lytic murein transglycosylase B [Pseudomonas nicosulfuronedens]